MNDLEQRLASEMDGVGDRLAPPHVDLAGLTGLGRLERRRRQGLLAGGVSAVVVAALAAGTAVLPDRSTGPAPGPATSSAPVSLDLPLGAAADLPFWQDGVLHVGSASQTMGQPDFVWYRAGTTLVATDDGLTVWRDEASYDLPVGRLNWSPALSADGRTVAWTELEGDFVRRRDRTPATPRQVVRVVVYDVVGQRVVDSFERRLPTFCCAPGGTIFLDGVLDDGRVLLTTLGTGVREIWAPGSAEPVVVTPPAPGFVPSEGNQPPDQVLFGDGYDGTGLLADVDADGVATTTVTTGSAYGLWNADGQRYVHSSYDAVVVETVDGSGTDTTTLPLPGDLVWRSVAWESDDDLLLRGFDPADRAEIGNSMSLVATELVRCDLATVTCERVADGPTGPALLPIESS